MLHADQSRRHGQAVSVAGIGEGWIKRAQLAKLQWAMMASKPWNALLVVIMLLAVLMVFLVRDV